MEPRGWQPDLKVAETPGGMLNSIGLQNPGVDKVIAEELKFLEDYNTEIFVNVAGKTVEDYATTAQKLSKVSNVSAIELNVSRPNVANGIAFGTNAESLEALTKEVEASVMCLFVEANSMYLILRWLKLLNVVVLMVLA